MAKARKRFTSIQTCRVEAKITLLQEDQQKLWSVNETLNLEKESLGRKQDAEKALSAGTTR